MLRLARGKWLLQADLEVIQPTKKVVICRHLSSFVTVASMITRVDNISTFITNALLWNNQHSYSRTFADRYRAYMVVSEMK